MNKRNLTFLFLTILTATSATAKIREFQGDFTIGGGSSMSPLFPSQPIVYHVKRIPFEQLKIGDIPLYHNYMYYNKMKGTNYWTAHEIVGVDLIGNYIVKGKGNLKPDFVKVTKDNYSGVILDVRRF